MQTHHEMPPINILPVNRISVSVEEASQLTGIPAATLNVWRSQGRGPKYVKISNRIYYNYDSLRKFIESNEYATADQQ